MIKMATDTTEKVFQNDIIAHLLSTGYHQRDNKNYNKTSCLNPELTLKFIYDTQPRTWKKFKRVYGDDAERKFFYRLVSEIDRKGTINVLRNGFKDAGCYFKLFYPKPNTHKNPDLFEKFEQNIYSFLSQLIPFSDINLEKMYIFNKFLNKKLPTINNPLPFSVLQDVDIDSYKIINKGKKEIHLTSSEELNPISSVVGMTTPEYNEPLSKIIKDLNDAFGTNFTDDDKIFLGRIKDNLLENRELLNKMEYNSRENVKAVFDKYFNQEINRLVNSNMTFYKRIVDNEKLENKLKSLLFELVFSEFIKKRKNIIKIKQRVSKGQ